jgi:hypothetical protein
MKNRTFLTLILGLIIALASNAYSQEKPSNTVGVDQTISFLLDENEKGRALIAAQERRIKDLEVLAAAEKENGDSTAKSYQLAVGEIESLKSANAALHKAIALNERTITAIEADREKWKGDAKKHKKQKYIAWAIAAGSIALRFFTPF